MPLVDPAQFTCPGCGAGYRWRAASSGRRGQCPRCSAVFRVPTAPGEPAVLLSEPIRLEGAEAVEPAPAPTKSVATEDGTVFTLTQDDEFFDPLAPAPGQEEARLPMPPPPPVASAPRHITVPGAEITLHRAVKGGEQSTDGPEPTPDAAGASDDGDAGLYELAVTPEQEEAVRPVPVSSPGAAPVSEEGPPQRCPNCGLNFKPGAVICMNCGYHAVSRSQLETQVLVAEAGAALDHAPVKAAPKAISVMPDTEAALLSGRHRVAQRRRSEHREYLFQEFYAPLLIIVVGLAILLATVLWLMPIERATAPSAVALALRNLAGAAGTVAPAVVPIPAAPPVLAPAMQRLYAVGHEAAYFALQAPLLFILLLLVSRLYGTALGALVPGLLKLAAMVVAADAVGFLVRCVLPNEGGGVLGMADFLAYCIVSFAVFWALGARFFELEYKQVQVIYLLAFLLPLTVVDWVFF